MFARTERLLLRPGWAEDAPALAAAIADEAIVRNLATAPWPYRPARCRGVSRRPARSGAAQLPDLSSGPTASPALVGACGLGRRPSGAVELGYWIAREHWGRGFATEAGLALIDIAEALEPAAARGVALHRQSGLGPGAGEARLPPHRPRRPALQLRPRRRGDGAAVLEVARRGAGKDRGVKSRLHARSRGRSRLQAARRTFFALSMPAPLSAS